MTLRSKKLIYIANIAFYSINIVWLLTAEFIRDKPIEEFYAYTDAAIKAMIMLLLTYSVSCFKKYLRGQEQFFASEYIMCIHLTIFICYLTADLCYILNAAIWYSQEDLNDQGYPENGQDYCRYKILKQVFLFLCQIADLFMMILLSYLSVKFSMPMQDDYKTKFLLLFQKENLSNVNQAHREHARAQRYNRMALRDAELIIIRALTKKTFSNQSGDDEMVSYNNTIRTEQAKTST